MFRAARAAQSHPPMGHSMRACMHSRCVRAHSASSRATPSCEDLSSATCCRLCHVVPGGDCTAMTRKLRARCTSLGMEPDVKLAAVLLRGSGANIDGSQHAQGRHYSTDIQPALRTCVRARNESSLKRAGASGYLANAQRTQTAADCTASARTAV